MQPRIHIWNILFSLFFLCLLVLGLSWLASHDRFPMGVSVWGFTLMTLAIFRLVRLTCYDVITQFVRDWFVSARENSFLGTVGTLLNCPWCVGLWYAFVVVFFYYATPYAWPVILVLALAGAASFIQIFANLLGWVAEHKKLTVQDM